MSIDPNQQILTPEERSRLAKLVREQSKSRREQNPTGKVVGIRKISNSPKIESFFAEVTKKRQAEATRATAAD